MGSPLGEEASPRVDAPPDEQPDSGVAELQAAEVAAEEAADQGGDVDAAPAQGDEGAAAAVDEPMADAPTGEPDARAEEPVAAEAEAVNGGEQTVAVADDKAAEEGKPDAEAPPVEGIEGPAVENEGANADGKTEAGTPAAEDKGEGGQQGLDAGKGSEGGKRREGSKRSGSPSLRDRSQSKRSGSPSLRDRSRDHKRDTKRRSRSRSRDKRRRHSRSRDKRRSRSRSRDRRRRRSRSRSRDRRRRTRSRSRSPRKDKVVVERAPVYEIQRVKPEERAPVPMMTMAPMMPGFGGLPNMPNMTGLTSMSMPNMPNMPNLAPSMPQMLTPSIPVVQPQVQLNQLTRPARRLYVGGLPQPCYDFMLTTFLNQALMALGICQVQGKAPIVSCQVTPERNFAFVEFSDTSDATAALQLDGIPFRGNTLKIKRPKDYTPPFGAPPDPTPLGPIIMAQLLANNSVTDAGGGAAAAPAAVQLPPGGLPLPGAGFPGAAAGLGQGGMPGL